MPKRLVPLIEVGVIDRVVRPLLSGKEARVYLVESGGELRAAKVYKDASTRSFRNRSAYTEARKVRNSRDQRAMKKRSAYGRERDEEIWNSAESDTIYKLHDAGVRVPRPYAFIDGVLVMECVEGPDGGVAPRIADCDFTDEEAKVVFDEIMRQVVLMLCADVVHADLSVYNILLDAHGPVVIDFPQSVGASSNPHARKILLRDVANITSHFPLGRPKEKLRFGHEIWDLYASGALEPGVELTGEFDLPDHAVDADGLIDELNQLEEDAALDAEEYGEGSFEDYLGG
jgi:RIO kinase 1